MSVQDHLLDITVIGCRNLKDTELFLRQDPYVILEYASNKYRTKTDTDGGRNPAFNEKYMLPLIEGLKEINVAVWNSNTLIADDFIGSGKILLQKALTEGYHDSTWPLSTRKGRRAGEIRVILHYTNAKGAHTVTSSSFIQQAPPVHAAPSMSPPPSHMHYPPPVYAAYPPSQPSGHGGYPPAYVPYPPPGQSPSAPPMPPQSYPPQAYPPSPPQGQAYPPQAYPPSPQVYPPYPPQGQAYPPQAYPPSPQAYPPSPPHGQAYPPQAYPLSPQAYLSYPPQGQVYPSQVYPPYPPQGHGAPY